MMALLFVGTTAFASPRTFNQAKVIAERQAAKLGIKIDNIQLLLIVFLL